MAQSTEGRARIAYRGSSAGLDQPVTQNARALQTRQEELKAQREAMRKKAEQQRRADKLELLKNNRLEEEMWPAAADAIIKEYNQLNENAGEMSWEELAEEQSRIKSLEKKYSGIWATQKKKFEGSLQGTYAVRKNEDGKNVLVTGEDLTEMELDQFDGEGYELTDNTNVNDENVMGSLNGAVTLRSTAREAKEIDPNSVATLASDLASEVTDDDVGGYYSEDLGKVVVTTKSTIGKKDKDRIREVLKENYKDALLPRVLSDGPKTDEEIESEINDWADQFIAFEKDKTDVLSGAGARDEQAKYDIKPVGLTKDRKEKMISDVYPNKNKDFIEFSGGRDKFMNLFEEGYYDYTKKTHPDAYNDMKEMHDVMKEVSEADKFTDFPFDAKLDYGGEKDYNIQSVIHNSETGDSYLVAYKKDKQRTSTYMFETDDDGEIKKDSTTGKPVLKTGTASSDMEFRDYELIPIDKTVNEQLKNLTGKEKVDYLDMFDEGNKITNFDEAAN